MSDKPSIAFLGTGLMGRPMAANLLKAGYKVTVWNRTAATAAQLGGLGALVASSPAEAVTRADVVITMLLNEAVVAGILLGDEVLDALSEGALVIDMSSIPPASVHRHKAALNKKGVRYLDAPVSGGTIGAAEGKLAIMVGGERPDFEKADPIFAAMGRATHVGPSGAGQIAKCTNQAIVSITIAAVAEGLTLASAGGLDLTAVHSAIQGGFADSRILREHGQRMITRNFVPGGPVDDQIKDLDTILATAAEHGIELPVSRQIRQMYLNLRSAGHGKYDHSALVLELERLNPSIHVGRATG